MKQSKVLFIFIISFLMCSTAEAYKWSYTFKDGDITNKKISEPLLFNGTIWNVTASATNQDPMIGSNFKQRCICFGSIELHFDMINISSSFFGGTINSVTVGMCTPHMDRGAILSVKVGKSDYSYSDGNNTGLGCYSHKGLSTKSFTGSSRGDITITFDSVQTEVDIKSITLDITPEITIRDIGWATYITPCEVDFSKSGLEAYAVKMNADNTLVNLKKIEGPVAAMTPVLVKGTYKNEPYTLTESSDAPVTVDTDLKAGKKSMTSTDDAPLYVLSCIDDVVGFYRLGKRVHLTAGRCYLPVPKTATAKPSFFTLDNSATTAITQPMTTINNRRRVGEQQRYNLMGQPVDASYRGIVIVNGQKRINK